MSVDASLWRYQDVSLSEGYFQVTIPFDACVWYAPPLFRTWAPFVRMCSLLDPSPAGASGEMLIFESFRGILSEIVLVREYSFCHCGVTS